MTPALAFTLGLVVGLVVSVVAGALVAGGMADDRADALAAEERARSYQAGLADGTTRALRVLR